MKNKTTLILGITFLSLALAGCGTETKKQEDTFRTVSYFDNNKEVRDHRVDECKKLSTMTKNIEKDCNNAIASKLKDTRSHSVDWTKTKLEWK